ncbi:MAG: biotin synthase BioB, partial [Hydrogenophaga sp.]
MTTITDTAPPQAASAAQPLHFHAKPAPQPATDAGTDAWRVEDVQALFDLPFSDLLHRAQTVHREHFDPAEVELATLLSVKTGGCPEDCGYCPQSVHFDTGLTAGKLMGVDAVREAAQRAKQAGATRFCMGAAWR